MTDGVRILKGVDETAQRHVDATTHIAPERAGQRARVLGHLGADGGEDGLAHAGQGGPQDGGALGRQRAHDLRASYKNDAAGCPESDKRMCALRL